MLRRIEDMAYSLAPTFVTLTWRSAFKVSYFYGFVHSQRNCFLMQDEKLWLSIGEIIQKKFNMPVLLHLTCHLPRESLKRVLTNAREAGIRNILALRGDPPIGADRWTPVDGGLSNALELVQLIREEHGDYFCVAVAAYPECHTECWNDKSLPPSQQARQLDLQRVKAKVDAGADFIVTQFFYDVPAYFQWEESARAAGIKCPILPGYMPIQTYKGFKKFTDWCKTAVPAQVADDLAAIKDDDAAVKEYGVQLAVDTCRQLQAHGCRTLHFYTMNLSWSVSKVLDALGFLAKSHERPLPWNEPLQAESGDRAKEAVRPIFWVNRAASYISRTKHWDEFPNGRWGSRKSPAFGELSDYYLGAKRTLKDRREMWGCPQSIADVAAVFVGYVDGKVPQLPWGESAMSAESAVIQHQLRWMNQHGFLTINSQPQVNAASSDHEVYGWGGKGGYVYQKSYVEFFCSSETLTALRRILPRHPALTFHAMGCGGQEESNLTTDAPNAVTWGVFPDKEVQQPTVVDPEAFRVWVPEAFELWSTQWRAMYEPRRNKDTGAMEDTAQHETARGVLDHITQKWWLVSIVDNDFRDPRNSIFQALQELVTSSMTQQQLQEQCLALDAHNARLMSANSALSDSHKKLSAQLGAALRRAALAEAEVASLQAQLLTAGAVAAANAASTAPIVHIGSPLPSLSSAAAVPGGATFGTVAPAAVVVPPAAQAGSAPAKIHNAAAAATPAAKPAVQAATTPAAQKAAESAATAGAGTDSTSGAQAATDASKTGSKRRHFALKGF